MQERRAIFRADKGLSQSVITGITTLFEYGLTTGGPGVMSISWIIVSIMTLFVGLGMAEVVGHQPEWQGTIMLTTIIRSLLTQQVVVLTSGLLCSRLLNIRLSSLG